MAFSGNKLKIIRKNKMKVILITIQVLIFWSFGLSQDSPKQVNENKNIYNQQKAEKVKSDVKTNETSKQEIDDQNSNVVDIQKSKQKIEVKQINKEKIITKEKKSFGSAKTSGKKQILEKQAVDEASMNSDAKAKINKLSQKRIELKKLD
jgi:hypothetical protein